MSKLLKEEIKYAKETLGLVKLDEAYHDGICDENGNTKVFYQVVHGFDISDYSKEEIDVRNNKAIHLLHIAAIFNNVKAIESILNKGVSIDILTQNSKSTALMMAAQIGAKEAIIYLIQRGVNISATDRNGNQAIHYAAVHGKIEAVEALLDCGADIEAEGQNKSTPLMMCASMTNLGNINVNIIRLLCERGANITAIKSEEILIRRAIVENKSELIRTLIEFGVSFNYEDSSLLTMAISYNCLDIVKLLCEKGANISATDKDGAQAIHKAAQKGLKDIVEVLLDYGADIEAEGWNKWTPLSYAAQYGHVDVIRLLNARKANVSATDRNGNQAIHYASVNGKKEAVEALLDCGANIEAEGINKWTPLMYAAQCRHTDVIRLLHARGANISATDKNGSQAIHYASVNGKTEAVRVLLDCGANIEAEAINKCTPLSYAAQYGHVDVIRLLNARKANISATDKDGNQAIHIAIKNGKIEAVEALLDCGANIEAEGNNKCTPLIYAAQYGYANIIRLLNKMKANISATNVKGNQAIHIAVKNGKKEAVEALLDCEADIEAEDEDEYTPLNYAARYGHANIIRLLYERGANINAIDISGDQAIHNAAINGEEEVVKVLLDCGANIEAEAENEQENTPLIYAAEYGNANIIRLLLRKGAKLDAIDSEENQAIHIAAVKGKEEAVRVLLEYGADIEAEGWELWTPFKYAASGGHIEIIKLLHERGANISDINTDEEQAIHLAAKNGYENVIQDLLNRGDNIEKEWCVNYTPLMCAVEKGLFESVKFILNQLPQEKLQGELNRKNNYIFKMAMKRGHYIVAAILYNKADQETKANIKNHLNQIDKDNILDSIIKFEEYKGINIIAAAGIIQEMLKQGKTFIEACTFVESSKNIITKLVDIKDQDTVISCHAIIKIARMNLAAQSGDISGSNKDMMNLIMEFYIGLPGLDCVKAMNITFINVEPGQAIKADDSLSVPTSNKRRKIDEERYV